MDAAGGIADAAGYIEEVVMLVIILLIFALACFAVNAFAGSSKVNLDAAGKAFLVGALIARLY